MMLKHLIDFRDFCYVRLTKNEGEQSAKWSYKVQLMGFFVLYYIVFMMLIATFMNRTGLAGKVGLPSIFYSQNFIMVLFTSLLLFVPYIFLFLYLFRRMAAYPINMEIPEPKYKSLGKKLYLHLLVGVALCFLVPWGLNKLIPPNINPVMPYETSGKSK